VLSRFENAPEILSQTVYNMIIWLYA